MAEIIWTAPALDELNEIAEYIALDKPSAAKKLIQDVFKRVKRLKRFPESGRLPPELPDSVYREIISGPCRVFYRQEQNKIFILYVMRGERALRNYLLEARSEQAKPR